MGMDHRMDGVGAGQETGGIVDRRDFTPLPDLPGPGDTKWIMLTFN
jgi:hypothetical protein